MRFLLRHNPPESSAQDTGPSRQDSKGLLVLLPCIWAHRSHSKLKIELKIKCCVLTFFRSHRKFKTKMNVWIRFSMLFLSYILFYFYFYFILIFESLPILVGCISVCTLLLIK